MMCLLDVFTSRHIKNSSCPFRRQKWNRTVPLLYWIELISIHPDLSDYFVFSEITVFSSSNEELVHF